MPSFRERLTSATRVLLGREERNVPVPFEALFASYGMPHVFRPHESLEAYGDNPWLGGAVDRIAQTLARTPFHLQTVNEDGDIEIIREHEALATLRRPQPTQAGKTQLTEMQLKLVTGYHLCLNGEAFWMLDKRRKMNGAPTFIDFLIPQYVAPRIVNGEIVEYLYHLPEKEMRFRPEDVVHFKLPDPANWRRGHPPVKSLRFSIDTHKEADRMNLSKIQNGAVPGGTLETEQPVTPDEMARLRSQWEQRYTGAANANKIAVLPKGLKFNKTQESNADMQYAEGKRMNREEILARFGVGPELLGLTDSQTRANAESAIFIFMKYGASFFIELFADGLTHDYLQSFPGVDDSMSFSNPDPVPENMEEKRLNGETLFRNGSLTIDEFRKMFGMEPLNLPGVSDIPYLDMGKLPLGADPPQPSLAL